MEQPLFPSHTVTLRPSSAHFFFSISHLVLCRSCLPFFFKPSSASHTNPSQWPSPRTTQPITRVSYPFAFSRARPPSSSSRLLLLLNLPSDDSCLSIPFPFSSPCFVLLFFFFSFFSFSLFICINSDRKAHRNGLHKKKLRLVKSLRGVSSHPQHQSPNHVLHAMHACDAVVNSPDLFPRESLHPCPFFPPFLELFCLARACAPHGWRNRRFRG